MEPTEIVNLGLKCSCGSRYVVYYISVPDHYFKLGAYCYKCLLNQCRATRTNGQYKIPMPMEWDLLARLKVDLGLEKPSHYA